MNSLYKNKISEEILESFNTIEKKILFLSFLGLYVEYNLNDFSSNVTFEDYCKFIEYLINHIGPNIDSEGGIIAMLKIIFNFISNRDFDGKSFVLSPNIKLSESIIKAASPFFKPNKITFVYYFLTNAQRIFILLNTLEKENNINGHFLNYIENINLLSLDIIDNYTNLLKNKENIPTELENTIIILKDSMLTYLKQDATNENLKPILKRITLQYLNLIPLIDNENKFLAISYWEMIYYLQLKDNSNVVLSE